MEILFQSSVCGLQGAFDLYCWSQILMHYLSILRWEYEGEGKKLNIIVGPFLQLLYNCAWWANCTGYQFFLHLMSPIV